MNLALPLTLGKLISILEGRSPESPWPYLFGYVALRFLQGSGGLAAIRDVRSFALAFTVAQANSNDDNRRCGPQSCSILISVSLFSATLCIACALTRRLELRSDVQIGIRSHSQLVVRLAHPKENW